MKAIFVPSVNNKIRQQLRNLDKNNYSHKQKRVCYMCRKKFDVFDIIQINIKGVERNFCVSCDRKIKLTNRRQGIRF